jgi:phosphatidylinositol glycan class O
LLLENITPNPNHERNDRKVVMLLVDGLREDFIDFGPEPGVKLVIDPEEPDAYKSDKFQIFRRLKEQYPERTFLYPGESAMPTITVIRVKSTITGGISTLFETTLEFVQDEVFEDTIFTQIKNDVELGPDDKIVYYGQYCWVPFFGSHFDDWVKIKSPDKRIPDELEPKIIHHMTKSLDEGSHFRLMGAHTVAIDNAAHHDHTHHPMVTKMIHVTEDMLEQLVEKIDDKTTLLVFGDHGFTQDGNHGGETRLELASAVFAY